MRNIKSQVESYLSIPTPNLGFCQRMAMRSTAYYHMQPYPVFGFRNWIEEERGPLPKCTPFCASLIKRPASWLFKLQPKITCTNEKIQKLMAEGCSKLYPKLQKAAIRSMNEGSITLRFSFDPITQNIRFSFLSTLDSVRFVYDPHDEDKVVMALIHYPIYNSESGRWEMYREAWTDEYFVTFKPEPIIFKSVMFNGLEYGNYSFIAAQSEHDRFANGLSYTTVEKYDGWLIQDISPNRLKFIPVIQIRDAEGDTVYGEGPLWRVTHILDKINLAYHLMDKSNQLDSDPTLVFVDAELDTLDSSRATPGGSTAIFTRESVDANRQAKLHLIEPQGRLRPYMQAYVEDLRAQVSSLVGTVELNSRELSNKGNFTQAVLNQLYAPLIESTDSRRANWENKLERFFNDCALAISSILKLDWNPEIDSFDILWPDYFILGEQEKQAMLNRLVDQEKLCLITKDRVLQRVAAADGVENVSQLREELKDYESQLSLGDTKSSGHSGPVPESINQAKPKGDQTL